MCAVFLFLEIPQCTKNVCTSWCNYFIHLMITFCSLALHSVYQYISYNSFSELPAALSFVQRRRLCVSVLVLSQHPKGQTKIDNWSWLIQGGARRKWRARKGERGGEKERGGAKCTVTVKNDFALDGGGWCWLAQICTLSLPPSLSLSLCMSFCLSVSRWRIDLNNKADRIKPGIQHCARHWIIVISY